MITVGLLNLYSCKKTDEKLTALKVKSLAEANDVSAPYTVSTVAGTGEQGYLDGSALQAKISGVRNLTVNNAGEIYFPDNYNYDTPFSGIRVYDGNSVRTFSNQYLQFLKFSANGDLFGTNPYSSSAIYKVNKNGKRTVYAGCEDISGHKDGPAKTARFYGPGAIAIAPDGTMYVSDRKIEEDPITNAITKIYIYIRKITPQGFVSTIVESISTQGGQLRLPQSYEIGPDGNLYILDLGTLSKVTPDGIITRIAGFADLSNTDGSLSDSYQDGPIATAKFSSLSNMTVDPKGTIYLSETQKGVMHRIRKISSQGIVSTIAGVPMNPTFDADFADGVGTNSRFLHPDGMVYYNHALYVADTENRRIRKITLPE